MPKQIFCAECGTELTMLHKALPKQQRTISVIAPHTCPEETPEYPFKDINNELITYDSPDTPTGSLDSTFDQFKFVKKTNDLNQKPAINPLLTSEPGDKRPQDSIAPPNILNALNDKKG